MHLYSFNYFDIIMKIFPDLIKIKILNAISLRPVSKILMDIHLYAESKNDYDIVLPLSDDHGTIEITKQWLQNEIHEAWKLGAMDYTSELDECKPNYRLSVLDKEDIKRIVTLWTKYKEAWKIKPEEMDALLQSQNHLYNPLSHEFELTGKDVEQVELLINESDS
jgi:hypothetical protein